MKEQPEAFCISWRQAGAKVAHHRRGDDSTDGDFRGGGSLTATHRHGAVQSYWSGDAMCDASRQDREGSHRNTGDREGDKATQERSQVCVVTNRRPG